MPAPIRFVAHSKKVLGIASRYGWRPGARYTNLRDIRTIDFEGIGFLDIHWKEYCFSKHLEAAKRLKPFITVARDVLKREDLRKTLREAEKLAEHSTHVIIVPKDPKLTKTVNTAIPAEYILGYSCPTRYGSTPIPPQSFNRPVHLLGGRPDTQRHLATLLPVFSLDCNRFTLDASFGDYFDGQTFRPLPEGGYDRCLELSIKNINKLWKNYHHPNH